ncbi:MAG: hypothetical protein DRK00_06155 [Thermoprotei archaeon]|nr:MAG: hypothetical protein DRK00_06155 [Thermoprotei archaeon]
MDSRERVLRAINLEEPDRVPVSLFMGLYWLNWLDENTFWFFVEKTDAIVRVPLRTNGIFLTSTPRVRVFRKRYLESGERVVTEVRVVTPEGELKQVAITERGITWVKEPFVKNEKDLEVWLSIPYKPVEADLTNYFYYDEKIGDRGLAFLSLSDPIEHVRSLFSQRAFILHVMRNRRLIESLLDIIWERFCDLLTNVLERGATRMWLSGPEHLCPTFFNPKYFDLVVKYDSKVSKVIHEYGGIYYMHCHGRIRQVLEKIKAVNVDVLDTIDPPPQGDCELEVAKRVIGDSVCLAGNVDSTLMAKGTPHDIEISVKRCIYQGAPGGGYILQPTSGTIVDVPFENLLAFIKAGRRYGRYPLKQDETY